MSLTGRDEIKRRLVLFALVLVGVLFLAAAPAFAQTTRTFLSIGDSKTHGDGDGGLGGFQAALVKMTATNETRWVEIKRIAYPGYTAGMVRDIIDRDLAQRNTIPDAVLINLGTNWPGYWNSKTYISPVIYIVDRIHKKWPDAQVFLARIWVPWKKQMGTVDDYVKRVVAFRSDFVHLGMDERTFLYNPIYRADQYHPNHLGYVRTAKGWLAVLKHWFPD